MAICRCIVCGSDHLGDILASDAPGITSTAEIVDASLRVTLCTECGHCTTSTTFDFDRYYEEKYRLHLDAEDDDDTIALQNGTKVYRRYFQADQFLNLIRPSPGSFLLEYGSGRANTLKVIGERRPDMCLFAYDIGSDYIEIWQKFLPTGHYAVGNIPESWNGSFDAIFSSFVAEHHSDPHEMFAQLRRLLKNDGVLIVVVPDAQFNPIDLLAIDHLQHYSTASLSRVAERAGFAVQSIDRATQNGTLWAVFKCHESRWPQHRANEIASVVTRLRSYGGGLQRAAESIRNFEATIEQGAKVCIHGSGVWGAFILTNLQQPDRVTSFVDQNASLHGRTKHGIRIVGADHVESDATIFCGLNPAIAQEAMAATYPLQLQSGRVFLLEHMEPYPLDPED